MYGHLYIRYNKIIILDLALQLFEERKKVHSLLGLGGEGVNPYATDEG